MTTNTPWHSKALIRALDAFDHINATMPATFIEQQPNRALRLAELSWGPLGTLVSRLL